MCFIFNIYCEHCYLFPEKLYRYYMLIVENSEITDMQKENIIAPNLTSQR